MNHLQQAMLHFGEWLQQHNMDPNEFSLVIQCANDEAGYKIGCALRLDYEHMTWSLDSKMDFQKFKLCGIKVEVRYLPREVTGLQARHF